MTLPPGTRLGPYEIAAPLGAGGMGEVYRARDTRLDRSVAIKVLPAAFAANTQLRARLEREARAISSLNHPNVCTLYDVGSENGADYLVMELIEGETLTDRIGRGPLPLPEALRYAIEIAGALEKAHRHGIVHRDLKPGNVMLTRAGAKLLDFGLSKPAAVAEAVSADSATRQFSEKPLTAEGTIVGTFQYMAPEQIEGRDADARTDIFAFGAVLYEMLTGRRAFDGKSRASMIAQILEREPPPVSEVQPMTPRSLDRVVRACLAKDPDDRFQTAHDVLLELRWIQDELSLPQAAEARRPRRQAMAALPWVLFALAAIAIGWLLATRFTQREDARSLHASIVPAPKTHFLTMGDYAGGVTLSPDGMHVAWVAADETGRRFVFLRSLVSGETRRLDATSGATFPFWSPDGKTIGFFADSFMKTAEVAGGPAQTICRARDGRGGAWSDKGDIVFAADTRDALSRVRATGGEPQPVTTLSNVHSTHRWPFFLPDGNRFLYLAANHGNPKAPETGIYVGSLDGKEKNRLLLKTFGSAVVAAGHLLYLRDTTLLAQPFDVKAATLSGEPATVARGVSLDLSTWRGLFDAAGGDILVYQSGGQQGARLTMFDMEGKVLRQYPEVALFGDVVPSPDGKRLLTNVGDPQANHWLVDIETGQRTRLTFEQGFERSVVWSPDRKAIVYSSATGSKFAGIYRKPLGGGARVLLAADERGDLTVGGITADGQTLLVSTYAPPRPHIVLYRVGDPVPKPLVREEYPVFFATLSPAGDLFAYSTLEEGAERTYIATFPKADQKWQVSVDGARKPVWALDGKLLYYLTADDQLASVAVVRGPDGISLGVAKTYFRLAGIHPSPGQPFAVLPDGRVIATIVEASTEPLTVVTNWSRALRQNVPR